MHGHIHMGLVVVSLLPTRPFNVTALLAHCTYCLPTGVGKCLKGLYDLGHKI
jgi:hypothetical protein